MKLLIINEISKLAKQEYNSRPDWVGKVIHKEIRKRQKFGHADKNHNLSWKTRCIKLSGILRYKRINESIPEDTT